LSVHVKKGTGKKKKGKKKKGRGGDGSVTAIVFPGSVARGGKKKKKEKGFE